MDMIFKDLREFEKKYDEKAIMALHQTQCACGKCREMDFTDVRVTIGAVHIEIPECPVMKCPACGEMQLCPIIPAEIYKAYDKTRKNGNFCKLTMRNNRRFEWAHALNLQYDSRDLCIPGLNVDLDPMHPAGYSCPVLFKKKILGAFYNDDDYVLDFFSESYGCIAKKGTDRFEYDWLVHFGINKNDRVIMFLGDLDAIDKEETAAYLLKSYNIESDHCVVDTELYRAQMYCVPSEPIIEKRILILKDSFYQRIQKKYGISLFHLQSECEEKKKRLQKPLHYTEKEISTNIDLMDGILNEGIDSGELKRLYKTFYDVNPPEDIETQTRKILEKIIAYKDEEASRIIGPLYALNDLRNYFSHLLSQKKMNKFKENALKTLGLSDFEDYKKLYDTLIERLYKLYQYLNIIDW